MAAPAPPRTGGRMTAPLTIEQRAGRELLANAFRHLTYGPPKRRTEAEAIADIDACQILSRKILEIYREAEAA